jgi:hypothetical protein
MPWVSTANKLLKRKNKTAAAIMGCTTAQP